jgi:NAD(P)-dependent dehydrogenase (short-subunit alcohol dehydrogenase family)
MSDMSALGVGLGSSGIRRTGSRVRMPGEMTRQLAIKGREHGIRANSISAALIEGNATRDRHEDPEWASAMLGKTLPGRRCRVTSADLKKRRERRTVPCLGRELRRDGRRRRGR